VSNYLAIAAATSTLARVLDAGLDKDVTGAKALPARPDDPVTPSDAFIRIFLYQVAPNAAWRNEDLPTRRADGSLVQRPQVALNLRYLISFIGNEADFIPQRLLGRTVRVLHDRPLLTREAIQEAVAPGGVADPSLSGADLAEQPELVRFTPLSLDLEDLSKLWSVFFQVPYQLSVAY
jgi:hypothetical protein